MSMDILLKYALCSIDMLLISSILNTHAEQSLSYPSMLTVLAHLTGSLAH